MKNKKFDRSEILGNTNDRLNERLVLTDEKVQEPPTDFFNLIKTNNEFQRRNDKAEFKMVPELLTEATLKSSASNTIKHSSDH